MSFRFAKDDMVELSGIPPFASHPNLRTPRRLGTPGSAQDGAAGLFALHANSRSLHFAVTLRVTASVGMTKQREQPNA